MSTSGRDGSKYQDIFVIPNIICYSYDVSIVGEMKGLSSSVACLTVEKNGRKRKSILVEKSMFLSTCAGCPL